MLTSNYYALLTILATCYPLSKSRILTTSGTSTTVRNVSDISENYRYNNACLLPQRILLNPDENTMVFGSSVSPESVGDYNVVALLQAMTYTSGGITQEYDEEHKKYTITKRYIVNNTSGVTQTINEYGIFGSYYSNTSGISSPCLIYREVLETPFSIEPNETVNFDLTLTYDLPAEYIPN